MTDKDSRGATRAAEQLDYIKPKALEVRASSCGFLEIDVGDGEFQRVRPVCAFPISSPNRYIALVNESGEEIGLIRELREMPRAKRKMLTDALERGYFVPRITRIKGLSYRFHVLYFDVDTDRGRRKFELRDRTENLRLLSSGKVVVEDVDGGRYVIENISQLDPKSQALLDPHI